MHGLGWRILGTLICLVCRIRLGDDKDVDHAIQLMHTRLDQIDFVKQDEHVKHTARALQLPPAKVSTRQPSSRRRCDERGKTIIHGLVRE